MVVTVAPRPLKYSHTVGTLALTGRGFSNPIDLALGANGLVYVLNRSNSNQASQGAVRITICTLDDEYVGQFSGFGEEDGQLTWPTSIARDSHGNIYTAEVDTGKRLQKFLRYGPQGCSGAGFSTVGGPAER